MVYIHSYTEYTPDIQRKWYIYTATPNIHLIYNENGISTQATANIHLIYNEVGIATQLLICCY